MQRLLSTAAGLALVLVLARLGEAGTPVDASKFEETVWCSSDQLSQATSMAWAPDGRLFILRQHGEIKTLRAGQVVATFASFPVGDSSGFAGALGICVDRNYASNKFVYVLATVANNNSQILRWTASGDVGTNKTTILGGLPTRLVQHDGGGIEMGPDGKLYFGMGDLGTGLGVDGDLSSLGSKIGRCNPDGSAPSDNPYYNAGDGITQTDYIWARGFRNAFGLTFRPSNGTLWVSDVGTNFEQIFQVNRNDHAGWDNYEGGNQPAGFIKPKISYATNGTTGLFAGAGCVSGGVFYTGSTFGSAYLNNFFWGDYNSNKIYYTRIDGSNNVLGHETFVTGASGFVDISQGPDGALYYVGFVGSGAGAVRRVQARSTAQQDLVVSATNLTVQEGAGATFTVRLAIAPAANVVVSVGRSVGDADVTASPGTLTFTPSNWSAAQTVTVSAAQDADTSNDSATITCSSSGLATKSVAVTVSDNDVPNGAPTASITKPLNGDVVSGGTAEFFGDGNDDVMPVRAEFYVDGVLESTDTTPASGTHGHYHYGGSHNRWDTTRYTNGQHTLRMTVVDAQGLTGSHTITVTVSNGALPVPPSGLAFWAKGDAGVTLNGSSVSQWADQSGNGRNATQSTAANQPTFVAGAINGKPAVRFDGASDHLGFPLAINGTTGLTLILVSSCTTDRTGGPNGGENSPLFWDETAGWGWTFLSPFQTNVKLRFGTTQAGNSPAYTRPSSIGSNYSTTISKHDGTTDTLYVNGTQVWSAGGKLAPINGTAGTPWIGRGASNTYFAGAIAEVLVYTRAITDSERQQIQGYLNTKYFTTTPTNQPPTVSVTAPANGASFTAPATITINASASDSDGTVTKVDFYQGPTLLGTDTASPYSFTWSNVAAGNYVLTARATDNSGATTNSNSINVSVTTGGGGGPVPTSGLAFWVKADGGVTLNGSTVSQWGDQSGNGRHATQGTAASQPTLVQNGLNGKPVVRFDGTDDQLQFNLPVNGLNGLTLVLVSSCAVDRTGGTNGGEHSPLFWDESASWGWTFLSPFQSGVKLRFGTTQTGNLPAYTRPASIGSAFTTTISKHDGTTDSLYVNGGLVWSAGGKLPALNGAVATPRIGRGTGTSFFTGSIAEILVYSRAITDGERQTIEQYLNGKYFTAAPPPPPGENGTGLRGEYFDNQDLTALKATRTDATVNFNWGSGSPDPSIGPDSFSCRWTGEIQPRYSQTYTFHAYTNDGVRLWVNNQQIINSWSDGLYERTGTIALTAGQRVAIRMETYEGAGTAVAQLSWSSPSQAREIVPKGCLYPAGAAFKASMVTINGNGDYATVQEAVDAAAPGDTVELRPSRYFVPAGITLRPGVTLKSGSPLRTILDGQGAGVVVRFLGGPAEGRSSLQGLTVTGGVLGIDTGGADVLLQNVQVVKNGGDGIWVGDGSLVEGSLLTVADNGGDGIAINSLTAAFRNLIVVGNGGVGISGPKESTVRFSTFFDNALGTSSGGVNAEVDGILLQPVAFEDAAALDYREKAGSPTIDSGDPTDDATLEPSPNGNRINQGAFGNTSEAAMSSAPAPSDGGSGGACGLLGAEIVLMLVFAAWKRRS